MITDETPTTDRTRAILTRIDERFNELQDLTQTVREIQIEMRKRESQWDRLWRAIKQFASQLKD